MDAKGIKDYINHNNLLEDVLHKIGCHSLTPYSNEIRCALPDDYDSSKVSVFLNDEISVRIFTKGETVYGSIFDLIMFIDQISFSEACKKCSNLLGLNFSYSRQTVQKSHPLEFFKKIKRKKIDSELNTYDISILEKYESIPHIDLIKKDGIISSQVLEKYHIKFDQQSNRILFPHFHYNDSTKIVGIVGRTVNPGWESLRIPKYFPLISYEKSKNLYGLSHNLDEIKRNDIIIVFEGEKSVLKSDLYGFPYGVSVGSHDISSFQKKLLISLDVEIVICFDNDVQEDHILNICNELCLFRRVSYIKDRWGLLKGKDSPVDRGYKKWNYLFRNRITI